MPGTARRGRRSVGQKKIFKSSKTTDPELSEHDITETTDAEKGDDVETIEIEDENGDHDKSETIEIDDENDEHDEIKTTNIKEEDHIETIAEVTASEDTEAVEELNEESEEQQEDIGADEEAQDEDELTEKEEMTVDVEMKESPEITEENVSKNSPSKSTVEVHIEELKDVEEEEPRAESEQAEKDDTERTVDDTDTQDHEDAVSTNELSNEPEKEAAKSKTTSKEQSASKSKLVEGEADTVDLTSEAQSEPELVKGEAESGDLKTEARSNASTPVKDEAFTEEKKKVPPPVVHHGLKSRQKEDEDDRPYPASLAKLRQLTVNIGPIRQLDLKSDKLHDILKLNDNFEIKFELRDKHVEGATVQEKLGFVRIPFEITTPAFLVRVAYMLGNLHIDGRDMSVRFPEAFNKALDECKKYEEETRKHRASKLEKKKRQIVVKNVPANVTEETIKSLFPEAQKITLHCEESSDGAKKVTDVLLDFDTEEACVQCLDTNKDVFIEDCQLKIFRLFSEKRYQRNQFTYVKRTAFGSRPVRGRGAATRGGIQAMKIRARALGLRGVTRGRGTLARGAVRGVGSRLRPQGDWRSSAPSSSKVRGGFSRSYGSSMGPPASPRGPQETGTQRGQFGINRQGSYPSPGREGQFSRQEMRGRQVSRTSRGYSRGNRQQTDRQRRGDPPHSSPYRESPRHESPRSQQFRSMDRSPAHHRSPGGHGDGHNVSSSFRNERSPVSPRNSAPQHRAGSGYRGEGGYTPARTSQPSTSREEDPLAMMNYLKTTIARMEEKMSQRDAGRSRDRYEEQPSRQYRGRGRGSPNRGRGLRGRGDQSRKRPGEPREYEQPPKRPFVDESARRDTRADYYGSQSTNSGARRESFSRVQGSSQETYRHGGRETETHRPRAYGDNVDRTTNRRESFGSRSDSYNTGQMGGRGGGRGGGSRGRGYSRGSQGQGQRW